MSKKIFPKKALAISGTAGHGKDTVKDILIDTYTDSTFIPIRMAAELKKMAATLLKDGKAAELGFDNNYDAMEHLKNTDQNYKVIGDLNARQVQQKLGTEVLRSFDSDIHIAFECAKIAKIEEKNAVYYSADVRFPNELEFTINLIDDPKDFAKDFVHSKDRNYKADDIIDKMSEVFNVDIRKNENFSKLLKEVNSSIALIEETPKPERQHKFRTLESIDMQSKTKEEAFELGYIDVFRPIVSSEFIKSQSGKNTPAALIRQEIREYTQISSDQVYDIQEFYKISKIDFTLDNVSKFGFLRADISHPSERSLDGLKPQSLQSEPMHLVDFKAKTLDLTANREIQKTLSKKEDSMKNKLKV